MTIEDLLDGEPILYFEETDENDEAIFYEDELNEAKIVTPKDYDRRWVEWPLSEKHYSKKTGRRLYGRWVYKHREVAGAEYGDNTVVHHRNAHKDCNKKSNLEKMSRAEHCRVEPNALKHTKCRICGAPHFSHGLCQKHYMQQFRKGKYGNYDPSKNRSKDER